MIDTNLLHRRINYRQFKKDVIPPKETIESIIKEAISVTPFKGSFKQASIDVYGANQTELKHNLMLTSSTEQSGTLRHQNYDLTDEQWEIKIKDYYSKHPEEFNTQIEAPYLIAVVENLDYYNYSETNSKEEIVTKNAMHNRLANAARHGALGYGLSLAANRHEVDACFCGCYNRKTEHRFNKLLRDYIDTNRSVLFLIGMGYYDFDAFDGGRMGGYVKTEDGENLVHNRHGGLYNIKTRTRTVAKHRKPKYDEFVEWK